MSEHENAFDQFVSTIQEDLLIHKKVFYLNHLLEKFVPFLPEDVRESYTTYRLQQKLAKHFGDAIVIQCQQGQVMSNIVYSSSICLSEAIDTANRLKADMKPIRTHDLSDSSSSICDENLILHKAVGILQQDHTIPPEKLRKCMALAETIVSINKNSFTPFSLGLALKMHHVYGSKNLVETLHSHGFCASYNELKRYLTSLADHEIITKLKIEHIFLMVFVRCPEKSHLFRKERTM